jgi:pSer/pThr/pTyr-binding forkhead associated (FHA) protein
MLLVKADRGRWHRVSVDAQQPAVLGRAPECTLVLPHASVSRQHARITPTHSGYILEDVESQNGVLLNGWKLSGPHVLRSRDTVQVGHFMLVFLTDGPEDAYYAGRSVAHLPAFGVVVAAPTSSATEVVSVERLADIARGNRTLDHGRVRDLDEDSTYWYPEGRPLTFGRSGIVQVRGWFAGGIVAQVGWDGRRHVLERTGSLVAVTVNDEPVEKRPLRSGDRFGVAGSTFVYEIDEDA